MHTYTRTHAHSHLRMPSNYISLSSFHSSEPDFRLTSLRPAGYNKTTRTALLEYNNEVWASEGEDSQTCGPSWKRACLLGPRWKTNVCAGGFQRPGVVWGEEKRGGGVRALGGGGHQSLCFLSVLFGTRDLLLNSPYWLAGNVRSHVAVEKKSWQEGFAHGDRDAIVCPGHFTIIYNSFSCCRVACRLFLQWRKKENRPIKSLQWPTRAFKAEGKFQDGQQFCRCVCIDLPTTVILWCGCPKICINLRGWIILLIPLKQPGMQILSRARNLIQMFLYICFSGLSGVVINLTGFAWLQSCSESVDSKGQENSLHYSKSGSFASDYTLCYT